MTSASPEKTGFEEIFSGWVKASNHMMDAVSRTWTPQSPPTVDDTKNARGSLWSWVSPFDSWEKMSTVMNTATNLGALFTNPLQMKDLPQMPFPVWPEAMNLSPRGEGTETDYNKEIIDAVMGIYHRELSKVLNIPKLGITRTYQEKLARAMDKFQCFQKYISEFINILNIPLKQSFETAQENLSEMAKNGCQPQDLKKYHSRWLKKLETKYHALLNSPEYIRIMGKTLDAMADFTKARQDVLQDVMKFAGVPVERDMDELYKDLYLLKKRLKAVEKQLNASANHVPVRSSRKK